MTDRALRAAVLALVLLAAAPRAAHAGSSVRWRTPHLSWLTRLHDPGTRSVPTGDGADWVTFDPAARTAYVANAFADTISVIDAATCNADRGSGCGAPVATLPAGDEPQSLALDSRSRTLYVPNRTDGTVSVFDVSACSAAAITGCGAARATVDVGGNALAAAIDPATSTVYVSGDGWDTLALIDGTSCNRAVTAGCHAAARVPIGPSLSFLFADPATRTIYVPGTGPDLSRLTVLDARACNARATAGCAGPFAHAAAGAGAIIGGIDPATRTVYVANADDNTVSVIDGRRCNAAVTSGCGDQAPLTPVAPGPDGGLSVDQASHTLYVASSQQDVMSVVDTTHCRAGDGSGCDRAWPTLQTGGEPLWTDSDAPTRTLYTADFADDALGVLDASACSALRDAGCRHVAPALDAGATPISLAIDRKVHTLYATDSNVHQLLLADSSRCAPTRCARHTEPVAGVSGPADIAVDEAAHTIYTTNQDDRTVTLIDASTCNVGRNGGCATVGAPIPIPGKPLQVAVDPRSHAVYVTSLEDSRLYRIDGAHCRIGDRSDCATVSGPVGDTPVGVEVDPDGGTVYTANDSGTVSVIDAGHCCAAKATVQVGRHPQDLALDPSTHTLYVGNFGEDEPGSVSVVDTRACNARITSGCARTPATLADGRGPIAVSVDPENHAVYTADILHGTLSTLDGRTCNALRTDGCDRAPRFTATSYFPIDVLLDGSSLYVVSGFEQTLQVLPVR